MRLLRNIQCIVAYTMTALMLFSFLSCSEQERKEHNTASERKDRIDQLRALPYLEGTATPQDAPVNVVLFNKARTCPGYRLYTIQKLGRAELINEEGSVFHKWYYQPQERWERAELLPNGDLLVIGMDLHPGKDGAWGDGIADSSRYAMKLDWSSRLIWKRNLSAHHDIELTPDGRLLLLTFKRRLEPGIHPTVVTRDDQLTLLDQDGTVLESMSMLDAIRNDREIFPLQEVKPSEQDGVPWVDLFHTNSVEWMHYTNLFYKDGVYGPNNILVCIRHQDRVAIFNWTEKKIVWAWGLNQLSGPHDAQMLKNGHILLFDNGLGRGWSRALEVHPMNGEIVWQYKGNPPQSFYTVSKGSAQRLPNGNTLLSESDRGRAIEVTEDGDVVWEFVCPYHLEDGKRAAIVRMIWHSPAFIEELAALHD